MNGQVRITLNENDFNKIVEIINNAILDDSSDKEKLKKLSDKLLTYSYIKNNMIVSNLFPPEARILIYLMNKNIKNISISKNWVNELISKKEEYKKNKEGDLND